MPSHTDGIIEGQAERDQAFYSALRGDDDLGMVDSRRAYGNPPAHSFNFSLTGIPPVLTDAPSAEGKKMWIDFAVFLVACQALTFGIIRIVEAIPLI
jgi:hypothetical protein